MIDSSHLTPEALARKMFRWDLLRGFFRGIITSGTQTFGLFIAIRYFNADLFSKSLIGSAPFMGMLFSLFLFHYAALTDLKKSICGSLPMVLSGSFLILAASTHSLWSYTLCIVLGFMLLTAIIPFLTSIYNDNYPADRRGAFFSKAVLVTVLVSIVSGFAGSTLMDRDPDFYRWVLIALGVAGLGKAYAIWNMPSDKIEDHNHTNPFNHMKLVWEDRSFGYVLLTWFIMGFANLWILPLRVDYLTSSTYGIEGSALFVATLITIVPDLMRAFSAPLLAKLFDRINFIVLRMIINIIFALGVGLFFLTKDPYVIGLASALIGIAFGGGRWLLAGSGRVGVGGGHDRHGGDRWFDDRLVASAGRAREGDEQSPGPEPKATHFGTCRMRPSWTTLAISRPSWVNTRPVASPRAPFEAGVCWS